MKFRIACQDCQAGESAIQCLSQGHNRTVQVVSNQDHVNHNHSALNYAADKYTYINNYKFKHI